MKKKMTLVMSIVLILIIAVSGTLAYFTDSDSDVNVQTLAYLKIVQNEQQRDGNGNLEDFEQGKVMLPVTNTDDPINWPKGEIVDGITLPTVENFVDKIVTVDNVGPQDAYVRVLIAFPAEMDDDTSADNMMMRWVYDVNEANGTWSRTGGDVKVTIDGKEYNVYNCTYNAVLAPDATTVSPAITGIFINSRVDATVDEATGDITYFMKDENGTVIKKATFTNGEGPKLYVLSQAVQAGGFADADTALNAGFGVVTDENAAEWFSGMEAPALVADADELADALAAGEDVALTADVVLTEDVTIPADADVTLNLNGKTLSYDSDVAATDSAITNNGTLTISNGTVSYEGVGDSSNGYATNTITNKGELVIDGATIINTTDVGPSYAIENVPGSTLVVNSGTIESEKTAIRVREGSDVTINGGEVISQNGYAVQIHLLGSAKPTNLTINDGTFTSYRTDFKLALYSLAYGNNTFEGTTVTINGGTFNGDVAFGGGNKTATENVTITGGTFNGVVGRYLANDGWEVIAH